MNYTLMHKRFPVVDLELDSASGAIVGIGEVFSWNHLPVGVPVRGSVVDRAALNAWWRGRRIPASRDGLRDALDTLWQFHVFSSEDLLEHCFGLSLSDQYWICPKGSGLTWDEVNFFDNPFSEDVGNILLGRGSSESVNLMSPDNSSDGWLMKKWTIINGKRCLLKGGSGATQQEPYNEALASAICERLGIPHIEYSVISVDGRPFSLCEDFITGDTDLIPAYNVMQTRKKPNHISLYQHFLNCCDGLGISGVVHFLDQMLTLDYLIANEDRHLNNFGLIRNSESLEYIEMAPIFDNGTSMWFASPDRMIRPASPLLPSKPFKTTHDEQVKLVSSFDWLDLSALNGIDEEFREILRGSEYISEIRCGILCAALAERTDLLKGIVNSRSRNRSKYAAADTAHDVQKNVAYSGNAAAADQSMASNGSDCDLEP